MVGGRAEEGVAPLLSQALSLARSEPRKALALCEKLHPVAEARGDPLFTADVLRARGTARFFLARYAGARTDWAAARALYRKAGEPLLVLKTGIEQASLLHRTGRLGEARNLTEGLRKSVARSGHTALRCDLASLLAVLRGSTDDVLGGLRAIIEAERLARECSDEKRLALCLANHANLLVAQEDFRGAEAKLQEVKRLFEHQGDSGGKAGVLNNLADLHFRCGRLQEGIGEAERAREELDRLGLASEAKLAALSEAEALLEVGARREAASLALETAARFEAAGETLQAAEARQIAGRALTPHGGESAHRELAAAEASFLSAGLRRRRSQVLRDKAKAGLFRGQAAGALSDAREASRFFARRHLPVEHARTAMVEGRALMALGRSREAERAFLKARETFRRRGLRPLHGDASALLGNALLSQGKTAVALRAYEVAAREAESVRELLRSESTRLGYMEERAEVFDRILEIKLAREHPALEDLFWTMERGRARILLALLGSQRERLDSEGAPSSSQLARLHEIQEELGWRYRQQGKGLEDESTGAGQKVGQLEAEAARLLRKMGVIRPGKEGEVVLPSLDEVRSGLPRQAQLIEYALVGNQAVALVITRNGAALQRLPATPEEIKNVAREFKWHLEFLLAGGSEQGAGRRLEGTLEKLRAFLVAPLGETKRLIFVSPHDVLHDLPIGALFPPGSGVSVVPSAALLTRLLRKRRRRGELSLFLGHASHGAAGAEKEVQEAARHVEGGRVFIGEEARFESLRNLGGKARILHLAGHLDLAENPEFSSYHLADRKLAPSDVRSLRLDASLVFLSACSMADGKVLAGQEVLAFYRAFLTAGARCLIAAHWPLEDGVARAFSACFYRNLADGYPPCMALARARERVRRKLPSPLHWGALDVFGPGHLPV